MRTERTADSQQRRQHQPHRHAVRARRSTAPVIRQNWRPHSVNRPSSTRTTSDADGREAERLGSTHSVEARSSLLQSTDGANPSSPFDETPPRGVRRHRSAAKLPQRRMPGAGPCRTHVEAAAGTSCSPRTVNTCPRLRPRPKTARPSRAEQPILEAARRQHRQGPGPVDGRRCAPRRSSTTRPPTSTTRSCARPPSCSTLDDLAESSDIPQFLAHRPRGVRARNDACGRSTFSCSARCACWRATSSRWRPVRARPSPARSPPPATRIAGRSVHVISVNDYLARRDAEWMGPLLEAMGLTVGWITADSTADERRAAYALRRHLRLGQRDRLRRAARPAGHRRRRPGLARPRRRAHRRGRLGARRRGAGAAGAGGHHPPRDAAAGDHPAGRRPESGSNPGKYYDTDADRRNVHLTDAGRPQAREARSAASTSTPRSTSAPR